MPEEENIVQLIKARWSEFSRQQLKVATYLVENNRTAGFLNATKLAAAAGVSQPTVIRFAQFLGFPQYQLFVEAFRKLIKQDLTSTDRLNISLENSDGSLSPPQEYISREIQTLEQLSKEFPQRQFDELVDAICASDQCFIAGTRGAASLAQNFAYFLAKVKTGVRPITAGGSDAYDNFVHSSTSPLLIAIAFPRYSRETIEIAAHCRERGIRVIGISDRLDSPLGVVSDQLLAIPVTFGTLFDSYCSAFCLFSGIVTAVGRKNRTESEELSHSFEELVKKRQIFI